MKLPYGTGEIECGLSLSQYDLIQYVSAEPLQDPEQSIRGVLKRPIASPPLSELARGRTNAVILISDLSRLCPSHVLLPYLLDALNEGGVPDDRIEIIVALGLHRKQTEDELRRLTGASYERVFVSNHSSISEDCVMAGVSSGGTPIEINRKVVNADLRIVVGNIEPHRLVGMSGGPKALFPGVASAKSITKNHSMSQQFKATPGDPDNPIHRDLEEAAELIPIHFLVNVVVNHEKQILGVYGGAWREAHRCGVELARSLFLVPVAQKYDCVVVSAGGYPKDSQMYQAIKALENAADMTADGGTIVLVARCEEQYGNGTFQLWTETMPNRSYAVQALKDNFVMGAHKLQHLDSVFQRFTVYLCSDMPQPIVELLGFRYINSLHTDLPLLIEEKHKNGCIAVMPFGSITFPKVIHAST